MRLMNPGAGILLLVASLLAPPAHATLTSDLQGLVSQLSSINNQISALNLTDTGSCGELGTLNTSIANYVASVETVTNGIAPVSLTSTDLDSLDQLTNLALNVSNESVRLSGQLRNVQGVYDLFEYRAGLSAMLQLSDDIGTMADRILQMADRILVMADNIGTMADRILVTQQLQNQNIALIEAAILTTQQNMVALTDSISTIAYNVSLGQIKLDTQGLSGQMDGITLTQTNMSSQLALLETTTTAVLNETVALYTTVMLDSQGASHYINGDTLTTLGDISYLQKGLALSLESYAQAINQLAPVTDNAVLRDATASMLRLANDIGTMSNRIVEMSNKITVMADDIGTMAGRIVDTQDIQQTNIELTQNSILTAQSVTLTVIRNFGL